MSRFLVVNDADYPKFLESELEASKYKSDRAKLAALSRSSHYASTMVRCPDCSRYILMRMDEDRTEVLVSEASA
jgi:DNA-directed RNA polymerase subunit RPC12/RpoP